MTEHPVWHESESFWEAFEGFVFPPEQIERAREQVEQVLELIDLDSGPDADADPDEDKQILDMPCGVGRHAIVLADCGFAVTGVDNTTPYLDTARERAAAAGIEGSIEFVERDMRAFDQEGKFDAAINLYTSFGYFDDRADDERVAWNFHDALKPGGALVMGIASKETLAGRFRKRTWEQRNGSYMLEEHAITEDWSRIENRWILVENVDDDTGDAEDASGGDSDSGDDDSGDGSDGDSDDGSTENGVRETDATVREFSVTHRLYSAFELAELLRGVGFGEVECYGDFEGGDFDENAEQLVIVARK